MHRKTKDPIVQFIHLTELKKICQRARAEITPSTNPMANMTAFLTQLVKENIDEKKEGKGEASKKLIHHTGEEYQFGVIVKKGMKGKKDIEYAIDFTLPTSEKNYIGLYVHNVASSKPFLEMFLEPGRGFTKRSHGKPKPHSKALITFLENEFFVPQKTQPALSSSSSSPKRGVKRKTNEAVEQQDGEVTEKKVCAIHYFPWTKGTVTHPIKVHCESTNKFRLHHLSSDEAPSSWLFAEETGKKSRPSGFRQTHGDYEVPLLLEGQYKYREFTFYETDNTTPIAYVFSSHDGRAMELVNLKRGKILSGQEALHCSMSYMHSLYPHAKPIFADMAEWPVSSAQREKLDTYYSKAFLKLIPGILTQKTYYETMKGVSYCEGSFTTYYNGTIVQQLRERQSAYQELAELTLDKLEKSLSAKTKPILADIRKKYFSEEITTLGILIQKIMETQKAQGKGTVCDDIIDLCIVIGDGVDLLFKPNLRDKPLKSHPDYRKYLVEQVTWSGFLFQIDLEAFVKKENELTLSTSSATLFATKTPETEKKEVTLSSALSSLSTTLEKK